MDKDFFASKSLNRLISFFCLRGIYFSLRNWDSILFFTDKILIIKSLVDLFARFKAMRCSEIFFKIFQFYHLLNGLIL
jgi:hypothetical protein